MKLISPEMRRIKRWRPRINSMRPREHKMSFCLFCECYMMICGACGNNTCNGGYGQSKKGGKCNRCPSAYIAAEKIEQESQVDGEAMIKWLKEGGSPSWEKT